MAALSSASLKHRGGRLKQAFPTPISIWDRVKRSAMTDEQVLNEFREAGALLEGHFILSSGDAESVRLLSDGVEGLRIGYDPCHKGAMDRLRESRDFEGFVRADVLRRKSA